MTERRHITERIPAMAARLRSFRWFLLLWGGALLSSFLYVNAFDGKDLADETFHVWQLWHPYYFAPLYSTFILVPAVLFVREVARGYGGFASVLGRAVSLLTIGSVLWGFGSAVWFYYNTCSVWPVGGCGEAVEVPYPSLADAGYLAILPFAAVALYYLMRALGMMLSDMVKSVWVFVVMFVPSVYLTWELPGGWGRSYLYDGEGWTLGNVISGIYVTSDVVLVSLSVILLINARRAAGGVFFAPILAVALSFLALYAADMFFFARVANETYYNADVSDGLYAVALFMVVFATYLFGRAHSRMLVGIAASQPREVAS